MVQRRPRPTHKYLAERDEPPPQAEKFGKSTGRDVVYSYTLTQTSNVTVRFELGDGPGDREGVGVGELGDGLGLGKGAGPSEPELAPPHAAASRPAATTSGTRRLIAAPS